MKDLTECRAEIDRIDAQLLALLRERLAVADSVADYKAAHGMAVLDPSRESAKIEALTAGLTEEEAEAVTAVWKTLFAVSRARQEKRLGRS